MPEDPTPHIDVAMFVLDKLSLDELATFRAHLRGCARCQGELVELRGLPDVLARAAPPTPPPPDLRARTLERVRAAAAAAQRSAVTADEVPAEQAPAERWPAERVAAARPTAARPTAGARPLPARWRRWRLPLAAGLTAAAAATVVVVAVSTGWLSGGSGEADQRIYAAAVDGRSGRAEVGLTQEGANRRAQVRVEDLDPAPAGAVYEMWLVGPDDAEERPQRVSLGTFTPDAEGGAEFQAVTAAPPDVYDAVGVTLEPLDGNPARSGPRVLAPVNRPVPS